MIKLLSSRRNKGFTLIEILVAITIIAVLLAISFISYRTFEYKTELKKEAQSIATVLRQAQNKTLASEDASQYGLHFETGSYTLFKGNSYVLNHPDNLVYQLPASLEIYEINLNGGEASLVFQRISGKTDQYGLIVLRQVSDPTQIRIINISSVGRVEVASSFVSCCDSNQVIDNRHIHLDLGWSIQGANTLSLVFNDSPVVTENIDMSSYFNGDQSQFSWSGDIPVNGQNQQLNIQTHLLDSFGTILCIHRDNDLNSKPVQILIDGQDIISYDAQGVAIIGSSGGLLEIQ